MLLTVPAVCFKEEWLILIFTFLVLYCLKAKTIKQRLLWENHWCWLLQSNNHISMYFQMFTSVFSRPSLRLHRLPWEMGRFHLRRNTSLPSSRLFSSLSMTQLSDEVIWLTATAAIWNSMKETDRPEQQHKQMQLGGCCCCCWWWWWGDYNDLSFGCSSSTGMIMIP